MSPKELTPVLARLGALGLRADQVRAVRDDYRRARCTRDDLLRLAKTLEGLPELS